MSTRKYDPRDLEVKEDELLGWVLDLAKWLKLRTAHFRPARTAHGWKTAVQGDGKGWLDLTILGPRSLMVAELKRQREKPDPDQMVWLDAWRRAGVLALVWRPSDWRTGEVERALKALAAGAILEPA